MLSGSHALFKSAGRHGPKSCSAAGLAFKDRNKEAHLRPEGVRVLRFRACGSENSE